MKKFLKFILWLIVIVAAIAAFSIAGTIIPDIAFRSEMKRQGFSKEEVKMAGLMKYTQEVVAKETLTYENVKKPADFFDEDGDHIGYYIDAEFYAKSSNPISGRSKKRYYFNNDRELIWWTYIPNNDADSEAVVKLKSAPIE